jgi:hypothetical protein
MIGKAPLRRGTKSSSALAICLTLNAAVFCIPANADPTDFDSSRCKSALLASDYASAARLCSAEAEATLNMVKASHLTGDSRADALGIAAIQMELAFFAQSHDGIASDAAKALHSLAEAKRLIRDALQTCKSAKCRSAMQHRADRIDSESATPNVS